MLTKAQAENEYEIMYKIVQPLAYRILNHKHDGSVTQVVDCNLTLNPNDWKLNLGNGIRTTKEDYVRHELDWYRSHDLYINGHAGIENNKIWRECASVEGHVNSNYGYLVFSPFNNAQFQHALEEMHMDKYTRRAAIIYIRPEIVTEQNDGYHARRDFICTYATSFLVQDDELHMQVHMRSNDFTYGFFNDFAWQCYVYNTFYDRIKSHHGLSRGKIHWHADSMHVYERDYELIKQLDEYYRTHKGGIRHE